MSALFNSSERRPLSLASVQYLTAVPMTDSCCLNVPACLKPMTVATEPQIKHKDQNSVLKL